MTSMISIKAEKGRDREKGKGKREMGNGKIPPTIRKSRG